jgi:lysophospholipase L1-like esterase
MKSISLFTILTSIFLTNSLLQADLLKDYNGDGVIQVTAFGDSITYGVGEGVEPGEELDEAPYPAMPSGYPTRLANLLGLPVDNKGIPGELVTVDGYLRFPSAISATPSDIVLILEGTNDVTLLVSQEVFALDLQQMINVAIASNKLPILFTLPPTCCGIKERIPFMKSYSDVVQARANLNNLPVVDLQRMWNNNCPLAETCDLYIEPEGLHPNTKGYTAIAQTVSAKLLNIDAFSSGGASNLESALGLTSGSVVIAPDPQSSAQ